MPDRMPEDMPDKMPEDLPDRMPEDLPDRMPDRMSEDMPDKMPEHIAEDMPGRMPQDMPDRKPEDMPDKMPEDMSDRMPEDLPVTKRIDVMVGIARSKRRWQNSTMQLRIRARKSHTCEKSPTESEQSSEIKLCNVGCLIVITPPIFFVGGVNLPIIIFGNL